jgi:hypothetical protein
VGLARKGQNSWKAGYNKGNLENNAASKMYGSFIKCINL